MRTVAVLAGVVCAVVATVAAEAARRKNLHLWLGSYLRQTTRRIRPRTNGRDPIHVLFCLVDHFEPVRPDQLRVWIERYPVLARSHRDSDGQPPRHTWFVPGEQYRSEVLEALTGLSREGFGEVELHLHHGHDTAATLRAQLRSVLALFRRHGALVTEGEFPKEVYGFIHGNMALDNSRNDAGLCGVDNEIDVLLETGCYADFSSPTAPADSQTRKINSIYYAVDDPARPKSHDDGVDAAVGSKDRPGLLLVQGPLSLDWRDRKLGLLPRIDNAEITGNHPGTAARIARWVREGIHVVGRPDWIVVKASCHGAEDSHVESLLGAPAAAMYSTLERLFRDRPGYRLHYVTARETYNIIKAAEAGCAGDPDGYRDFVIPPYRNRPTPTLDG